MACKDDKESERMRERGLVGGFGKLGIRSRDRRMGELMSLRT